MSTNRVTPSPEVEEIPLPPTKFGGRAGQEIDSEAQYGKEELIIGGDEQGTSSRDDVYTPALPVAKSFMEDEAEERVISQSPVYIPPPSEKSDDEISVEKKPIPARLSPLGIRDTMERDRTVSPSSDEEKTQAQQSLSPGPSIPPNKVSPDYHGSTERTVSPSDNQEKMQAHQSLFPSIPTNKVSPGYYDATEANVSPPPPYRNYSVTAGTSSAEHLERQPQYDKSELIIGYKQGTTKISQDLIQLPGVDSLYHNKDDPDESLRITPSPTPALAESEGASDVDNDMEQKPIPVRLTPIPVHLSPRKNISTESEAQETPRSRLPSIPRNKISPNNIDKDEIEYSKEVIDFGADEDNLEGPGCCGWILTIFSVLLILITVPVSLLFTIKVVQEYERAVIFRLGRLLSGGAKGPGIFFIIPCVESYTKVDLRTVSFDVPPQEVLTKDSVTVSVDAVVYYRVSNPTISVANVENAHHSTRLLAQTTLRNILGTKNMSEILSDREAISVGMQSTLDEATDRWGIRVERVEIKDVRLPVQLQRAMAAEAEAAREARAKVIAAEGEHKASRALKEASDVMNQSPAALQLRYLQTLNSISAEKNSTIIFPLPIDILSHFMKKR